MQPRYYVSYSTFVLPCSSWTCEVNPLGFPTSCSMASVRLCRIVWISSGLWFCGRSFGDRVEVFAVSVPLSQSLGRIQPLSGIKLVIRCSQQVILILLIYCREDRATLVPIISVTYQLGTWWVGMSSSLSLHSYIMPAYLMYIKLS